jgi:hypothetical protein
MSHPPVISIDFDDAGTRIAELRAKADEIERMGAPPVSAEQLRGGLGEFYEEYVQAKVGELASRQAAYQRLADEYRAHADKLENTRTGFDNTEQDSAQNIAAVLDEA